MSARRVSENELLASCAAAHVVAPPTVTSVAIITCNRPESLRRSLASHLAAARHFGRRFEFLVMDDSVDPDICARNLGVLGELKAEYGVDIRYGGRLERNAFVTALARGQHVPEEVLSFALLGGADIENTCGANRNGLLLDTLGELTLSADDDTSSRVAKGTAASGVAFGVGPPLGEFEFFDDPADAQDCISSEGDLDLVALHEQLLGHAVVASLRRFAAEGGIEGEPVPRPLLAGIAAGRAHTRVTQMGFIGDPGTASPFGYLLLEGASRARLLQSERRYRAACARAPAMRKVERLTVSAHRYCMSYVLGLDNRGGLPPFFPMLRSSDAIFGLTLRACDPDAYLGQIPYAVCHAPPEQRRWDRDEVWRAPLEWRMSDVVQLAMTVVRSAPEARSGVDLPGMGRSLIALASRPLHDFEETIREQRIRREKPRADQLRLALARHGDDPGCWAEDAKRALGLSLEVMEQVRLPEPQDLPPSTRGHERRLLARGLVRSFGQLLCNWDGILDEVRSLRRRGVRLTEAI